MIPLGPVARTIGANDTVLGSDLMPAIDTNLLIIAEGLSKRSGLSRS
jgi:hypothetical protein